MSYTALAPYLRPEYPKFVNNEGSVGNNYLYRGPSATISANVPLIGELWEDGRLVTDVQHVPSISNSALNAGGSGGIDDLSVSTSYARTAGGPAVTTLEEERYQIRWQPQQLPLIQHPAFQPGAASDVFTAIGGKRPIEDIIGWEYEQDPNLKAERKYKKLQSDGTPSSTTTTVETGTGATAYVKLRQLGYDSFTVFLPIWTKVSIYRGEEAPGVGDAGQYEATGPDGTGFPAGYEWVKSGDSAERIGNAARWQRTEEWMGFVKVYFDTDTLNPAGHTIP